ncbi:hypothetical protein [Providencia phage PSTCR7]|uniref:Uncharacterized protein n=1 Tax=Providencia phage PSTCR7 TaxID=2783549 RepID=A0A7S9XF68_9CAUD|nr:hypothetical protein PQD10_gp49 [Providencia phage PSTCR7]QPI18501.1 hypothetical protein [Providencia phage PSTCR7]
MQVTKTVKHINVTMQDIKYSIPLWENLSNLLPELTSTQVADLADELRYEFLANGEADVNYTISEELELFIELV